MRAIPELVDVPPVGRKILPRGIHRATVEQVRECFVAAFPDSVKRRGLFDRWLAHRYVVRQLLPITHEYVDGSFVTSRANPTDIDVSYWVDGDSIVALPDEGRRAIKLLFGAGALETFGVDAYLVPSCSEGHELYEDYVYWRDWTEQAWERATDKKKRPIDDVSKGYLEIVP